MVSIEQPLMIESKNNTGCTLEKLMVVNKTFNIDQK